MRVTFLAQVEEHNTMSPARTKTWTTRFSGEHTNHEATAPYNVHTINKELIVPLNYNQGSVQYFYSCNSQGYLLFQRLKTIRCRKKDGDCYIYL